MTDTYKSITVLVICYKQQDVIKRALDSVLCQKEYGLNKIVVCDDCSPDKTWDVLQDYKSRYPEYFEIHRNEHNLGIYQNMEKLVSLRGESDLFVDLSGDDAFENGFFNFLRSQEGIKLQESELDNAYDFIKKHLESTVGYWSENEVAIALKDWRIAENEAIEEERRRQEEEERRRQEEEERKKQEEELKRLEEEARQAKDKAKQELKGDLIALSKKKVSARELIDNASREMLHDILDEVINLDYEFIVDKILEHQN